MNINKTISFVKSRIKYHIDNMRVANDEVYYNNQLKKVEHYEQCLIALFEKKQNDKKLIEETNSAIEEIFSEICKTKGEV